MAFHSSASPGELFFPSKVSRASGKVADARVDRMSKPASYSFICLPVPNQPSLLAPLMRLMRSSRTWGPCLCALACAASHGAQVQSVAPSATYLCPGNLLTNQIDAAQALAQNCVPAGRGRLSQASVAPSPPAPATAISTASAASSSRRTAQSPKAPPVPFATRAEPAILSSTDVAAQRARDTDARAILQSELTRTLAAQQALAGKADSNPESRAALDRLRADEAALRRELARLPI